jgi:hypothetical protein
MKKILVPALTVFALFAVSSCGDDPDASGPPILVLSAANGGGWSESAPAASDMAGADGKMMWNYQQNFTAAADLPALDSNAPSYTLTAGDASTDSLNALKAAFGVTKDFVAQDATQGGGYLAGNYDGTTATLYVGSDAMRYWSYSPAWDQSSISSRPCIMEDAVATSDIPTTDVAKEICAEPVAPENVPTKAEAEELFAATMTALGVNNDDLILDSYSDEWGANVTGYLKIDGVRSPLSWSVGYGADASITWASGVFADVQDGASYPRIGTAAAIERLNSQQAGNWGGPMVRGGVAYDTAVASDIAATPVPEPASSDVEAAVTTEPATSDAAPTLDAPAPEVQEVSIVAVEEELVTLYGADGSIYLVPGYTFIAAEDEFGYVGRYTVSALPDEYMQVTDAVDAVPATDVPVPDTAVARPSVDPAVDPAVDPDMSVAQDVADTVLGMSEAEATKTAEAKGLTVRVGSRDGEDFPLTMDYRTDRVTLTVVADKVTAATPG